MSALLSIAHDPNSALTRFIAEMQKAAPFGPLEWREDCWDLTGRLTRAGKRLHLRSRDALLFIEHRATRGMAAVPFDAPFADFAKAIVCARHLRSAQTVATHRVSVRALRYLYDALRQEKLMDPCRLENRHFVLAENAARLREMLSSAYRVGQRLQEIAGFVDHYGFANIRVRYRSAIPKSDVDSIATKMPKSATLDVLGAISGSTEIYQHSGRLICMRAVDLLVATGFRIGEALTLPAKPIVRCGDEIRLRYWPEKGGKLRLKAISSVHRELVERAVADLSESCRDARRIARWYERHPGRAPLPESIGDLVTARDLEEIGLAKSGAAWLRSREIPTIREGRVLAAMRSDVEKGLLGMYDSRPLLATGDGRTQALSESLIVTFHNETHDSRGTNKFVPTSLTWGAISAFLGGHEGTRSIFALFAGSESEGASHKITSHQFRHWLSTIAKRGGLSEVELARWMGRRRIADNRAYDHRTQEERVEEARGLIKSGRAAGPLAEIYKSLPSADGETFLAAQVNAVLSTPYGMCVHDYGQGPCERHFSCAGCGELLRRKGDVDERAALNTMLERTRAALASANAEDEGGTYGAANWIACNQRLEVDLISMLSVDSDETHCDGELVRVWPQERQKGPL